MKRRTVSLQVFEQLIEYKNLDDRDNFIQLMRRILPEVTDYVHRRLSIALKNGKLPENKYHLNDFMDELYIIAYDHIQEVHYEMRLFTWLLQKADQLIKDTIIEEDFDDFFFHNIEDFSQEEWNEIVNAYSTKGEINSSQEDNEEYLSFDYVYTLDDVFSVKNGAIKKELSELFEEDEIHDIINLALHKLPNDLQTIFDLRANHELSLDEIKDVKQFTSGQIYDIFIMADDYIQKVFLERAKALKKLKKSV